MKRIKRILIAVALLMLASCSTAKVEDTKVAVNDAIASAREEINMACWAMQTADVAFTVFVAPKADPAILENERKAIAAANAICANPPSNVNEAIASILNAYKVATTATAVTP